jgi:hypothetical protein
VGVPPQPLDWLYAGVISSNLGEVVIPPRLGHQSLICGNSAPRGGEVDSKAGEAVGDASCLLRPFHIGICDFTEGVPYVMLVFIYITVCCES